MADNDLDSIASYIALGLANQAAATHFMDRLQYLPDPDEEKITVLRIVHGRRNMYEILSRLEQ